MTPSETAKLVGLLMVAFPNFKMASDTAEVYEMMLDDLDYEATKGAVRGLLATCRFFPTIAEIRAAVVDAELGPTVPALVAWGRVCDEIRRVGANGRPRIDDALTARCVDAMDWRYLCRSSNDAADRARFCELYGQLRDQRRGAAVRGELPASGVRELVSGVGR
jgi:hypothetical protein